MRSFRFSAALVVLLTLVFSILCFAQTAPVLVTQPIDNSVRTVLTGNLLPLARPQYDQGEVPASMALHRILLVLKRSDQQETTLRRLIENQQYKKSPSYHQWLTPQQFGQQFGPADSDIAAVTNWLTANGFSVTGINNGRTVIEFDGTAGQIKQAFGTAIHRYLVNGEEHIANSTEPSIPTALAPIIRGFDSLHDFRRQAHNIYVGKYSVKKKQLQSPAPGYTFASGSNTYYALGPYDFATIYNEIPLWNATPAINGNGVTIAIVGRTDIDPTDATDFWGLFGFGQTGYAPMPTLNIIYNGPNPGVTSDEGEADIDTQWSGAAAPGATIDYVASESTETTDGVDLSALYIVDNNLAPVMSESYGSCEGYGAGAFYGPLWEQAAAQGISAMVSAGDNGSAGCDDPDTEEAAQYGENVSGIASTPWNAAVGGTDFNQYNKWSTYWNSTNAAVTNQSVKTGTYIPETTWDNSCTNPLLVPQFGTDAEAVCNNSTAQEDGFLNIVAGSGGYSGSGYGAGLGWLKPTWQTGTGVPNDNARDLPDVSLFASNGFLGTFYIICQKDQTGGVCNLDDFDFLGYGGTSVASPAFAGIMALVNQQYGPQGVPGLILYSLASKQPTAFHDVPAGTTNSVPCYTNSTTDCNTSKSGDAYGTLSGWSTTADFDLATGLGSVNADNLVNDWNDVTFTPTTTDLTLNGGQSVNITHGSSVTVGITVTPESGSGTPTGDVAILVAPGTPGNPGIDFFTLSSGAVTSPTNMLPGGKYSVIAHYAGDTNFGGGYSAASPEITVNPEKSYVYMPGVVTGVDSNGNPIYSTSVVYGTGAGYSYLLRADVQNSQQNFCSTQLEIACPTGSINFTNNGSAIDGGTFPLNSAGYTEDQNVQLPGGSDTILAAYSGDASYKSSSASVVITVTPATTAFGVLTGPTSSVLVNQSFSVGATIYASQSYGAAPTGTVTFFANGNTLPGTVQYTPTRGSPSAGTTAALAASLSTSISTAGTYNLTVTYSGDSNYSSLPSANIGSLTVISPQDVNVPATLSNPSSANPGQTTTTTMQLSTADGNPFNSAVSFACSGLPADATYSFNPSQISSGASTPQTVQITISTTGPFTGAAGSAMPIRRQRAMNQNHRLWLPFSLPLAGILFVGFGGRRIPRAYKIAGLCLTLVFAGFLVACGGSSSSSTPITVSITPTAVDNLFPNLAGAPTQEATFTANVTGATNPSVTWTAGGVAGGNSTYGTISGTGTTATYTAPATLPTSTNIPITATVTGATSPGNAAVNLQTPTPAGTYPITITVTKGPSFQHTTTFNLTVAN